MRIERQRLFEMVWRTPLYKLAPDLGISDRGLAKLCERYFIPLPPKGFFWKPLPQNKARMECGKQSACVPYHALVIEGINSGINVKDIFAKLKTAGFPGSRSAVQEYVRKLMKGHKRYVKSRNRFGSFVYELPEHKAPYEVEPPPLPVGPVWVYINERPPEVEQEQPPEIIAPSTLLDSIQPELEYARERHPELFLAFWLEVGTDLPNYAHSKLRWEHVDDNGKGQWSIEVPLSRKAVSKLAPSAVLALQDARKDAGPVLTRPHMIRQRLCWILGPDWKRHCQTIRQALR